MSKSASRHADARLPQRALTARAAILGAAVPMPSARSPRIAGGVATGAGPVVAHRAISPF